MCTLGNVAQAFHACKRANMYHVLICNDVIVYDDVDVKRGNGPCNELTAM